MRISPFSSYSQQIGWVQVCVNGVWGGICGEFFNDEDAIVVCRQLGYTPIGKLLQCFNCLERNWHTISHLNGNLFTYLKYTHIIKLAMTKTWFLNCNPFM